MTAKLRVAILGGGAAGVGLLWALAMAKRDNLTGDDYAITLIHDDSEIGGHSKSWPETINGQACRIDLGVQVIAPAMYPTVSTMLAHDDFAGVHLDSVNLRIACAFPDTTGGAPYWGNFPAYQNTALYQQGQADAATFETLIGKAKSEPLAWALTLRTFLDGNQRAFKNLDFFEQYFLNPYMSIMNGYGSALLDQVIVGDVIPIFDWGLGAFTHPTQGFARFRDGAAFWVQTMAEIAKRQLGADLTIELGTNVASFAPGSTPTVTTQVGDKSTTRPFDMVISTLDMFTTARLLYNKPGWDVLGPYVGDPTTFGTTVWPLQPGFCYLHQDPSILAPGMPGPLQETLQFTAPVTPKGQRYDLNLSYTTYIESNLLGIASPDQQYYLTMYGLDPAQYPSVPVPKIGIQTSMNWVHGMWLPSFMAQQKLRFHAAQGISRFTPPLPSQKPTNLFFAGNNLTMDSEEGALLSGLAVAKYAFGFNPMMSLLPTIDWKDVKQYGEALLLFEAMYELMFAPGWAMPGPGAPAASAAPRSAFRPLAHVLGLRQSAG